MDNDKLFDLMSKMYSEMQGIKSEMKDMNIKLDNKADKTDIVRLENTLAEKLGGLFDARGLQLDVKQYTDASLERIEGKLDDLTLEVGFINHRERETEKTVYTIQKHLEIIK